MLLKPLSILLVTVSLIALLSSISSKSAKSLTNSCLSPEGKSVDWSIIYTLPKSSTGDVKKFIYIDDTLKEFKPYEAVEEEFPPLKIALELNNNKEHNSYLIWNDDPTNGDDKPKYDESFAHSKGLLSFDSERAVYIIHSLPRFPFRDHNGKILNKFSSNYGIYGQTFFCMSLDNSQVDNILDILLSIKPQVLLHSVSAQHQKIKELNRKIQNLIDMKHNLKLSKVIPIKTIGGLEVKVFVENEHGNLPWDSAIPQYYEDSFYVETWTRPSLLPNICDKNGVFNMVEIKMLNFSFRNTDDHSKWGVSVNKNILCFGDLNRTNRSSGHIDRLGSVACFEHEVSLLAKNFIRDYERCDGKDHDLKFLESA
jgi:deoxyribonuclease-2